jgi:hypothetical protein
MHVEDERSTPVFYIKYLAVFYVQPCPDLEKCAIDGIAQMSAVNPFSFVRYLCMNLEQKHDAGFRFVKT